MSKIEELQMQLRELASTASTCERVGVQHDQERLKTALALTREKLTKEHVKNGLGTTKNMDALETQCRLTLEALAKEAIDGLLYDVYHDSGINLKVALAHKILGSV